MSGKKRNCRQTTIFSALIIGILLIPVPTRAMGQYLEIYGGPTLNTSNLVGYQGARLMASIVRGSHASDGVGVAGATRTTLSGDKGLRAVRWDAFGEVMELGHLGTAGNGVTESYAQSVNGSRIAVGYAAKYVEGVFKGDRAVQWDASGAVMELGNIGVRPSNEYQTSYARAINDSGTSVGTTSKFIEGPFFGVDVGLRAVRWDISGTAVELGDLGTASGYTLGQAFAINNTGTAVGYMRKFVSGSAKGFRAVRWDASGTAATELDNLGMDNSGNTEAYAHAINDTGMVAGQALKYVAGNNVGHRAVRWEASGTIATELGNLGTDGNGKTDARAIGINSAGTTIGMVSKFVGGTNIGPRAVRWAASSTIPTELGNLGNDTNWFATEVLAINDDGIAVGNARNMLGAQRAVMWGPDNVAIDLNTLIDPAAGWLYLSEAGAISDDNWIAGVGEFDPDGPGGGWPYTRLFLIQVPEPSSLALLAIGALAFLRRTQR